MFTGLQINFLIFIAVVFVITVGFAILILRQMKITGQKALEAKQRQQNYQNQVDADQKKVPAE